MLKTFVLNGFIDESIGLVAGNQVALKQQIRCPGPTCFAVLSLVAADSLSMLVSRVITEEFDHLFNNPWAWLINPAFPVLD